MSFILKYYMGLKKKDVYEKAISFPFHFSEAMMTLEFHVAMFRCGDFMVGG